MSEPRLAPVEVQFVPKTYDIDFAGHVSNITFVRWLEDLRYAWLERYYPLPDQMAEGLAPTLLRTEIDYHRQVKLFEPVRGLLWVEEAKRLKYILAAEFTVGTELRATARQVGVWFRPAEGRPVRLPARIQDLIDKRETP